MNNKENKNSNESNNNYQKNNYYNNYKTNYTNKYYNNNYYNNYYYNNYNGYYNYNNYYPRRKYRKKGDLVELPEPDNIQENNSEQQINKIDEKEKIINNSNNENEEKEIKINEKKEIKERKPRKMIEVEPKYGLDNKNEIKTLKKDKKKIEVEPKETENIIKNKTEIEIEPEEILIDNKKNEKTQTDFVKVQAENILIEKQPKTNSSYKIDNKQISINSNNKQINSNNNNNNIPLNQNQRMNYPYQMYYNNMKSPMTMMQIDPKNPNQPIYYMMIPYNPSDINNFDKDKNNNFNNMNYLYYQKYMMQNFQNMKNDNQEYPYINNTFGYNMNHMNMMENKK